MTKEISFGESLLLGTVRNFDLRSRIIITEEMHSFVVNLSRYIYKSKARISWRQMNIANNKYKNNEYYQK